MSPETADSDPAIDVFSRPATARVLCAFLDIGKECSARDVIETADVSHQTFYDNVEVLREYGLVERTQKHSNAWLYRACFETDAVRAFQQFRQALEG